MISLFLSKQLQWQSPYKKWAWFSLAVIVIVLDQWTKNVALSSLSHAEPVSFLPYFNFTLLFNYGAAFSFLADAGGWQRIVFSAIALLVSVFLIVWILCVHIQQRVELAGLSLILGGAIGNLWDRVQLGYVVDFIDWFYVDKTNECLPFFYSIFSTNSCHWPAFNIADSAILLGAACLLIDMFVNGESNK